MNPRLISAPGFPNPTPDQHWLNVNDRTPHVRFTATECWAAVYGQPPARTIIRHCKEPSCANPLHYHLIAQRRFQNHPSLYATGINFVLERIEDMSDPDAHWIWLGERYHTEHRPLNGFNSHKRPIYKIWTHVFGEKPRALPVRQCDDPLCINPRHYSTE